MFILSFYSFLDRIDARLRLRANLCGCKGTAFFAYMQEKN